MFKNKETKPIAIQLKAFTKETLQQELPVKVRITDEMLDNVNNILLDEANAEIYKQSMVSFASVLGQPNIQVHHYFNAVRFVTFVMLDYTYLDAWRHTFPDRYQAILDKGGTLKDVHSHVTAYRKTKIVSKILEQALVPSYIYNQALFQEAINTQASIMRDVKALNKDRIAAADSVLKYTQIPEALVANRSEVAAQGASIIEKLADSINKLAATQQRMIIDSTSSAKDIAHSRIYEGEYEEVE